MPQNYFHKVNAPSVVAVRRGRADSPQRCRQKFGLNRAVVIPLVKIRAQIVAFEIGKDVPDQEWQ